MPKQHLETVFSDNPAVNYERYFVPAIGGPLAKDLVETASLRQGERVLDVACGTGIVARLAAERVGKDGIVEGLDAHPGMLGVAESITPSHVSIEWHEASAEKLPMKDETFDVVLCQMGLQFVPDKPAALSEMRRVLVPRGRLVMNLPGIMPPIFEIMDAALKRHLGPEPAEFIRTVFSLADASQIRDLVDDAGFREVDVQVTAKPLRFPPPEEFFWQYINSTPLMEPVSSADETTRAALEEDVLPKWREIWRAFETAKGVATFPQQIVVTTARK